ncbi:VOC family protein [Nocardia goodfellowii]|uniref:Catechol-2,3-dioxygenase n=1 Tax=Nocardia goodfellowii TaxID=882446 RepID=A0ABS4QA55_9NOCA|nr:VOC family protein [Nocardia goodfellowii]MBP2187974.1 catechol-2,3-dioxygenase [Nocardia goodfellowii]
MTIQIGYITFDADDAAALAGFYADLLGKTVDPDANRHFATVGARAGDAPALMFIQVPDKNPGKNVVHLDLASPNRQQQVERAIGLGAKHVGDFDEFGQQWTTLADPEGNLFDIGAA